MTKDLSARIILDVIIFVSILLGWWFVAVPIAIIGAYVFPKYAEIVIAGFLYDSLFSIGRGMGIFGYAFTIGSILAMATISYIKAAVKNNS